MSIKQDKTKKYITLVSIFLIICIPILIFSINRYTLYKAEQEALRVAEEERIAKEKEQQRILELPISKTIYLSLNEPYEIECQILDGDLKQKDKKIIYSSSIGISHIYNPATDEKYEVYVTDIIDRAHIDNYKDNIYLDAYTNEEALLLDTILKERINDVGYKTRAAVVEAARFLSMNFKYKIPYFCENGRLTGNGCDGEGRFYHEGLYLSQDKFNVLNTNGIFNGPTPWGGLMHHTCGQLLKPNGLDCSGFVTWCLVQAGFDPGDYGAGSNYEGDTFCLIDLANGDAGAKWLDEIDPNIIQAGDIIAWEGTVAIVVGVDEENIYTAHQYWDNGLEVVTDTKISLKDYPFGEDCGDWQYVSLMDEYYNSNGNGQGKYSAMWPEETK